MKKNFGISAILAALVIVCAAAIEPARQPVEFRNLKVLPKNISDEALQKIMEVDFNKGLGVGCDYCHAKAPGSNDLDFASDAKGEKEIARNMMRMTLDINQKYFGREHPVIGDTLMSVSCRTCHQGEPYPSAVGKK